MAQGYFRWTLKPVRLYGSLPDHRDFEEETLFLTFSPAQEVRRMQWEESKCRDSASKNFEILMVLSCPNQSMISRTLTIGYKDFTDMGETASIEPPKKSKKKPAPTSTTASRFTALTKATGGRLLPAANLGPRKHGHVCVQQKFLEIERRKTSF